MIIMNRVSKIYGNNRDKAVDSFSWKIPDGQIGGLVGSGGEGKTFMIKMLAGIMTPDSGSICLNGLDISKNAREAKKQISYLPDNIEYYRNLSIGEYFDFIMRAYEIKKKARKERLFDWIGQLGLSDGMNSKISTLPEGSKGKVKLIGALIPKSSIWIMDEPFRGLEPNASDILRSMMRAHVCQGNTIFLLRKQSMRQRNFAM